MILLLSSVFLRLAFAHAAATSGERERRQALLIHQLPLRWTLDGYPRMSRALR
jgi:hypothetical protein